MTPFKKRETLVQNITYMALMAAINVVFVLLTTFVPVLFFLIVFVLPLTSTIVALLCNKIYFPIYALSTIILCLVCTIWKIDDTIFYVIPSIISGFVFAIMVEKQLPAPLIIIATTIIQMAFSYASIPLIKVMTGRYIVNDFASIFGLKNYAFLDYVVPCFIFFMALMQETLSFIVTNEEIKKFGYELKKAELSSWLMIIFLGASLILMIIFAFTYKPLAYAALLLALYFTTCIVAGLLGKKKKWLYITLAISLLVSFFLFALIYQYIPEPLGLLCVGILFFCILIIGIVDNCLIKHSNKTTI